MITNFHDGPSQLSLVAETTAFDNGIGIQCAAIQEQMQIFLLKAGIALAIFSIFFLCYMHYVPPFKIDGADESS